MQKVELIELTLDQLLETFKTSPESFDYKDRCSPGSDSWPYQTIIWQPKFQLKTDNLGDIIADPNNLPKTVAVYFNHHMGDMQVLIFNKSFITAADMTVAKADSYIACIQWFPTWRAPYRKMMRLKRLIEARNVHRENDAFLRKLYSIFPGSLDRQLFK